MPDLIFAAVGIVLLGGLIPLLCFMLPLSKSIYTEQLVRTSPDKWGRACSAPDNEEQVAMWEAGLAWAEPHKDKCTPVQIENDGFQLFGEYYDFGKDRCIIILPGRCESLMYSYYFAPPYEKAGFNVLVIDTRCHGKSEGIYNTIGVKESRDVLAWAEFVCNTFGKQDIYMHGICIGTSAGLFALSAQNCPDYLKGLVTEGCFVSFRETFKRHMIAINRPRFPVLDLVMMQINRHTGTNVYRDKPIRAIKRLKKDHRVLFLYGTQDIFSIPEKTKELFAACSAEDKKLVWFHKGGHSHLRINNTQEYDDAIIQFFN